MRRLLESIDNVRNSSMGSTIDGRMAEFTSLGGKPEKEIFKHSSIKEHISETYGISWDDFIATLLSIDHHEWVPRLARRVDVDEDMLLGEIARVYAYGITESEAVTLTNLLKEASQ